MNSDKNSASPVDASSSSSVLETAAALVHPHQLEVNEFSSYALVIDARSPHEYDEDHIPGAVNLPVVDDGEYAEVGTAHKTDKHAAYLIGVEYSLKNIAAQLRPLISKYRPDDRFLVYCFRGGKRSRLWADSLRTIGFEVDVLVGGWKNYRRWVRAGLESLPRSFSYRVLCGPTGCGKTRVLHELARQGHQVLDLEALARHRGSLLGDLPGEAQPTQKFFDTQLLDTLRCFDARRTIWLEAESKKIGNLQLPQALYDNMHAAPVVNLVAAMSERVKLWREDYPHFAADPIAMVGRLVPLKAMVGNEVLAEWTALARSGQVEYLFESVMTKHYDPCYARSSRRNYG
ncbi:MAG: tRNA 2-selenouridine(34) synthase MnmH, partial [Acidobacteriota bacterium]|nr:tRNA 2-selenouridine(34) synthase MnmH [Acidobacteriota bacterium]